MKRIIFLFFLVFLFSCGSEKPKNLLSKDEMAEIIVDLAIYEQVFFVNSQQDIDVENINTFVFKKHKTNAAAFRESHTYYLRTPDALEDIYKKAKEIIISKDPKMKEFIKKNNMGSSSVK